MPKFKGLAQKFQPDFPGLIDNLLRRGTPKRVYFMELFHDAEIQNAVVARFDLARGLDKTDPDFWRKQYIAYSRFCGYDYVQVGLVDLDFQFHNAFTADTADLNRGERRYRDEHTGPITTWEEFEKFPWPDANTPSATRELEWFQKNLPDDMCITLFGGIGQPMEYLTWLMGYETLCFALFEQRDLVEAIVQKLDNHFAVCLDRALQFDRVKIVWGSDDMGFKTGLMISPDDMRKLVLPCHRQQAARAHAAGLPYLLHSCGQLADIMEDLIENVKIDAKHSYEDTIVDICDLKRQYGKRLALLGGIDMDFLCRSDEAAIRARVRKTLHVCLPGGGYCLGTGNTVANYIPLDNYLTMLDEGRLYSM